MIRTLLKDIAKYLPSHVVPAMVGIVLLPILTHAFSPDQYGDYILVRSLITILCTISVGWVAAAVIRFYASCDVEDTLQVMYTVTTLLTAGSVTCVILVVAAALVVLAWFGPSLLYDLLWVGLAVLAVEAPMQVLMGLMRARRQAGWYSAMSVSMCVGRLGLVLGLVVWLGFGVSGLLWAGFLAGMLSLPVAWLVVRKRPGSVKPGSRKVMLQVVGGMTAYGLPLVVVQLAGWVIMLSDRYVIKWFCQSAEVGIYSAGHAVAQKGILFIVALFAMASTPILFGIWEKKGPEQAAKYLSRLCRYFLLVGLPAAVGVSALARPLMSLLTAPDYFAGHRIIPIVALSMLTIGVTNWYGAVLTCYKKTRPIMYCNLFCGALNFGLNMLLVPMFGYMAAAVTSLVSFVLDLAIKVVLSRRHLVWRFPLGSLLRIAGAAGIMAAVLYKIGEDIARWGIVGVLIGIFTGTVVYAASLFILGEVNPQEKAAIRSVVIRLIRPRARRK